MNIIRDFCSHYKRVNADYILTGRGEPLLHEDIYDLNKGLVPLYKSEAAAGFGLANFNVSDSDIDGYYRIKDFFNASFMLRVRGKSMEPLYNSMKVNAYAIHLRNIRAVFNYAIDEEYTMLYPFRKFKIKAEETRKRSLTLEQLRELRDYPCEEHQVRYRDMFMLMFYLIGINAADLFQAKKKDVINGRLEYKRAKTGRLYSVKIEPEAQAIIDKYAGKGDYLLNMMDSYANYKDFLHRMGIGLKQIGEMERVGRGGRKVREPAFPGISSYWSRHTWATLAASLDVPKETISEALGHSFGLSVTSIYIRFDQRKVDEANRRVIDLVNGQPDAEPYGPVHAGDGALHQKGLLARQRGELQVAGICVRGDGGRGMTRPAPNLSLYQFNSCAQHFADAGQHVHGDGEPAPLYLADGCPLETAFSRQVFLGHSERLAQFGNARAYPFSFVHHIEYYCPSCR